jgi:RavJ, Peptidase domain/Domain of unknown function (DUF5617)
LVSFRWESIMSLDPRKLRQKLNEQKYGDYAVTDVGNFPQCLPRDKAWPRGVPVPTSKDPNYTEWHDGLTAVGKRNLKSYNDWVSNGGKHQARLGAPKKASGYFEVFSKIEKKDKKASECSNFAYHSIGVMLQDPKITSEYNVVMAGIMGGAHNIAILVPKGEKLSEPLPKGRLPEGSLIVDPWAVGMGHSPDRALAVSQDNFAYRTSINKKFKIHYQSADDPTVDNARTEYLENKDKVRVDPYAERAEELARQGPVNLFGGSPPPARFMQATVEPSPPEITSSPPPREQSATKTQDFPASYTQMWKQAKNEVTMDGSATTNKQQLEQMKKILNDYTKGNSRLKRFFTGHWNRHHVKAVNSLVKDIDAGRVKSAKELITKMEEIAPKNKPANESSFKRRLDFMKKQVEQPREERGMGNR